jgi:hypothetical protein
LESTSVEHIRDEILESINAFNHRRDAFEPVAGGRATASDLFNAIYDVGREAGPSRDVEEDVAIVKKAIQFLTANNIELSSDDFQVAQTVAKLNPGWGAQTPHERMASILASLLIRGTVAGKGSNDNNDPANKINIAVLEKINLGSWKEDAITLVNETTCVLGSRINVETGASLSAKEFNKNQSQFGYIHQLISQMDERVLVIMFADWLQRLRRFKRGPPEGSTEQEKIAFEKEKLETAVALEGYALPFMRALEWPCLDEFKNLLVEIIDPKAFEFIKNAIPNDAACLALEDKLVGETEDSLRNQLFYRMKKDPKYEKYRPYFDHITDASQIKIIYRPKDIHSIWEKMRLKIWREKENTFKYVLDGGYVLNESTGELEVTGDYKKFFELDDLEAARMLIPDKIGESKSIKNKNDLKRCLAMRVMIRDFIAFKAKTFNNYFKGKKEGKRPSRYRAIHQGIVLDELNVELQMLTESMDKYNKKYAPHTRYKNTWWNQLLKLNKVENRKAPLKVSPMAVHRKGQKALIENYDEGNFDVLGRLLSRLIGQPIPRPDYKEMIVGDRDGLMYIVPQGTKVYQFIAGCIHSGLIALAQSVVINGHVYFPVTIENFLQPLRHGYTAYIVKNGVSNKAAILPNQLFEGIDILNKLQIDLSNDIEEYSNKMHEQLGKISPAQKALDPQRQEKDKKELEKTRRAISFLHKVGVSIRNSINGYEKELVALGDLPLTRNSGEPKKPNTTEPNGKNKGYETAAP